jgi:two-component system, NtrC family, response regulator HydG
MRPKKLSSNVFLELPPVLAHYIESNRNHWMQGNPKRGRLRILDRPGSFQELESQAVERRQLFQIMGKTRARALKYNSGFEVGRREALQHYTIHNENGRLALQAGLVYGQVQGRYIAEDVKFEFDLEAGTLYREVILQSCTEALVHGMVFPGEECSCCYTAGYISGHISELTSRNIITIETECLSKGDEACRFVSKLDVEWEEEANWVRNAMNMASVEDELAQKDNQIAVAQKMARQAPTESDVTVEVDEEDFDEETFIAESSAMLPVIKRAELCCQSKAPVFITGEPGTGKASLARSIHLGSERYDKPFIEIDCRGMNDETLRRELLGYEQGAIPGSLQSYEGALQRANGGTLYFNEIIELSPVVQGLLVKFIQTGGLQRIGADEAIELDVRIIAATQSDPDKALKKGALREDLYYALGITRIDVPPLRLRDTDLMRLAEAFLYEFKERHARSDVAMTQDFKDVLLDCSWQGNVRQLRNVMEHSLIMSADGQLTPKDLPEDILASRWVRKPDLLTEEVILATLNRTHNNRSEAAELLGVGRTTLWRAMKKLGID